jgi:hypothetical protein
VNSTTGSQSHYPRYEEFKAEAEGTSKSWNPNKDHYNNLKALADSIPPDFHLHYDILSYISSETHNLRKIPITLTNVAFSITPAVYNAFKSQGRLSRDKIECLVFIRLEKVQKGAMTVIKFPKDAKITVKVNGKSFVVEGSSFDPRLGCVNIMDRALMKPNGYVNVLFEFKRPIENVSRVNSLVVAAKKLHFKSVFDLFIFI